MFAYGQSTKILSHERLGTIRSTCSLVPRPSLTAFFAAVEKSCEGRPRYEASLHVGLTEAAVGGVSQVSPVLRFLFAEGVAPFVSLKVAALLLTALRGSEGLGGVDTA